MPYYSVPSIKSTENSCVLYSTRRLGCLPFGLEVCTTCFHQTDSPSRGSYPQFGNSNCHLSGRYPPLTPRSHYFHSDVQEGGSSQGSGFIINLDKFSVFLTANTLRGDTSQFYNTVFANGEIISNSAECTPASNQGQSQAWGTSNTLGQLATLLSRMSHAAQNGIRLHSFLLTNLFSPRSLLD